MHVCDAVAFCIPRLLYLVELLYSFSYQKLSLWAMAIDDLSKPKTL